EGRAMKLPILGRTAAPKGKPLPGADFRVALVLPPFAPCWISSLALASLSAGVKAPGMVCRTVYLCFAGYHALGAPDLTDRVRRYEMLSGRISVPFNEWVFARELYGDEMAERDRDTWKLAEQHLARFNEGDGSASFIRDVIALRHRSAELIAGMVD